jgi:pimeloyl-ACP methyl ester carboxylesterase
VPAASEEWPDYAYSSASERPKGVASGVGDLLARLQLRVLGLVSPQTAARRGVDLFCTPRPTAAAEVDTDAGAQATMLQVDGHELATYVWGDPQNQPYVLMAHGWSGHALGHLAWVAALRAAGYAVVAFDQQAHGRSSGTQATLPDFVCNLLAVGWRHGRAAAVIGHALGGTAAAAALSHGLEADRAILVAAQADPEDAISRFAHCVGLAGPVRRRMIALLETHTGVEMDALQAHRTAPKIGRPALVVHDVDDDEVPWAEGERYARYWPHSRLLTTTGLGHHRIANNPQVIAAGLRFLQGKTVGERVVSSPNLPYGLA